MALWHVFVLVGLFMVVGLFADEAGRRTRLPRVTILLLCGILAGRSGFGLIPAEVEAWFQFLSIAALTMVAFLLGGSLTWNNLAAHGRLIMAVSFTISMLSTGLVAAGLWLIGVEPVVALVLGAIAAATAPAATADALKQAGVEGDFVETLRGVVAIDDAWGLMIFSLVMVVANGHVGHVEAAAWGAGLWDIFAAVGLAVALGGPAAFLTGRVRPGEPLEAEAIGIVFLSAGLSLWLEVSFLITGMTIGAIIANFATHHQSAFHEIDRIQWPFMILFFILAGASLELDRLADLGWIGGAYLLLRVLARIAGGWIGALIGGAPAAQRCWFGVALLPQAGVAIGMALVASETLTDQAGLILTLTIGSTIVFELIGPIATVFAVRRVTSREQALG